MESLRHALGRRSGPRPNDPDSQRHRESESWSYPTARSGLRLELWRVGRAVVALGLLVPIGAVSTLAVGRTRLWRWSVRLGLVPCRHFGTGPSHALVHHSDRQGPVLPNH